MRASASGSTVDSIATCFGGNGMEVDDAGTNSVVLQVNSHQAGRKTFCGGEVPTRFGTNVPRSHQQSG
jgi:hypothetical protein